MLYSYIETWWLEEFCLQLELYKNNPLPKYAFPEEMGEICTKVMIVYQKFAGVSDWIQINWSQRTGNKAISRSSSDPFWYPEICSPLSPLALAISSSLDITEAWTLYFTRWIWGTSHFPIFSFGTFLHNKAFFTPNSDVLSFGLSNCQAYPLDWS